MNITKQTLGNFDAKWKMIQMILDSIKRNEGITVNKSLLSPPSFGYMTGFGFEDLITRIGPHLEDAVINWVFRNFDGLEGKLYAGAWSHDGYLHLEISQHIPSKVIAMNVASSTDQIAIWDLKNDKEIRL